MKFQICIPSYNRPGIPALRFLENEGVPRQQVTLYLHDKVQLAGYRKVNDLKGYKIELTGARCMTDQRNYILRDQYPARHVQMDDDVTGISKINYRRKPKSWNFIEACEFMFSQAAIEGVHVWGTGVYSNPYWARKQKEISYGKFFRNNLVGIHGYNPVPRLVGPVGTDWELGLCALRDRVGLMRFNWVVLDVSLGTDTEVKGGIGKERWRFNGTLFRDMAQRYVKFIGRKELRNFYPGLIRCLDERWLHYCMFCKSGFWDELHWKIHKLYPCPQRRQHGR